MFAAIRRASSFVTNLAADPPAGLILEIDVRELLVGAVDDDKAGFQFIDQPGRREARKGNSASAGTQF
jgi:hypothetical protein